MLFLNVGSGQRRFDSSQGWVNIDCVSREGQVPDLVCDARTLPYPDDNVDICCLHHVLEHFGCGEADDLIKECYRVLKPGGSLLVFVPDLKQLADRWVNGGEPSIDDFIFMVNVYGAYQGEEGDRHKWGYCQKGLESYLSKLREWTWVGPYSHRPIPGANIALDWWIAMAEAIK